MILNQEINAPPPELRDRYLELLKHCLTGYLFIEGEAHPVAWGWLIKVRRKASRLTRGWGNDLFRRLSPSAITLQSSARARQQTRKAAPLRSRWATRSTRLVKIGGDRELREIGADWPPNATTMVGLRRLDNLQECVVRVLQDRVPGDLIETGVWRGGSAIFMRAVLAAYGDRSRRVWVADSFQGLPLPDERRYPADAGFDLSVFRELAVGLDDVKANFEKYKLLDEQVQFLVGWFKDTLPAAPINQLAVIRLDGDLYQSTMEALTALYPKLSPNGYIIIDDYGGISSCRQAVTDYRRAQGISEVIETIDWTGVYWRKSAAPGSGRNPQ